MKKYIYSLIFTFCSVAAFAQIIADIKVEIDESVAGVATITGYANNATRDLDMRSFQMAVGFNNYAFLEGVNTTVLATSSFSPIPFQNGDFNNLLLISLAPSGPTNTQAIPMGTDVEIFRITFGLPIARAQNFGDIVVYETADAPFPGQIMQVSDGAGGNLPEQDYTVSGLLPVELVSFEAEKHENTNALLTWATSQEINSDYFQIEGSENGYDWAVVGKVAAAGFSNSEIEYSYVDQNVATLGQREGTVKYYRLRIVDLDRTYDFSDVKSVSFDGRESKGEMAMFPNPSKYGVTIEFDNDQSKEGTIQIFDVTGKNMYNVTTSNESYTQHYIDLQKFNISAGTYMVIVNIDGEIAYSDKLIVQE